MRKVHYRVVLDIFTIEDDDAEGCEALHDLSFWPQQTLVTGDANDLVDIQDVVIESIEVTDSR